MRRIFLDTSFLFAAFFPEDGMHVRSLALSDVLLKESAQLYTTRGVLVEFLTLARKKGAHARVAVGEYVRSLLSDPRVKCIPDSEALFDAALDLYMRRGDKMYSMTDCMAMVVCGELEIREVLTYDEDFAREGFTALLRET